MSFAVIRIIAIAAVLAGAIAAALFVVQKYNAAISENAKLQDAVKAAAQEQEGWKRELEFVNQERVRMDLAIKRRDVAIRQINQSREADNARYREALSQPGAKAWADEPIPSGVLGVLLSRTGAAAGAGANPGAAPAKPDGADPSGDVQGPE